jgi:glycerol-3-phosphate cytidylyltransferase/D-beta-D-heptose 7-phosphate kinase/D-beta-D-heptose 1-phosphate adenosyltransferase
MLPRMPQQPTEASIVSGYFNPLHVGHLDMMEAARSLTGYLVVIVNNDAQQVLKKGKVIQTLDDRLRIVRALRVVDDALGAVDQDATVRETLRLVRERYPNATLTFANGGDRSQRSAVAESDVCEALGINLRFAVGGETKADSSSRINASQGLEPTPPAGLNRSRPGRRCGRVRACPRGVFARRPWPTCPSCCAGDPSHEHRGWPRGLAGTGAGGPAG